MLSQKGTYILLIAVLSITALSCSNSRHLPDGELLFRGSRVSIKDNNANRKEKKVLRQDLAGIVRPKPNTKTLGVRLKLTLYNIPGGDLKKQKGLRYRIRNKIGEPPVLVSSVKLDKNKELMVNLLQNRGFFYAGVAAKFDSTKRSKKATAVFDITTGPQYTINKVYFRKDSSEISQKIDSTFSKTLLKPGEPYNLALIKAERARIDRELKELGYFYFTPDYILVIVDTSVGNHKVDMYVRLKHRDIPPEVYLSYTINDIYIYTDYRLNGKREDTSKIDTVTINNYHIVDKRKRFKPKVFSRAMAFEKGQLYSLDKQNATLSRLVNMGTFKFVKNRFERADDTLMDVYYYLTPMPKKSLRFEIGAHTQNDNRAGTRGSISWRNRNTFRGAEELMIKLGGGIESQYSGPVKQPDIYNLSLEANLSIPRFVVPFIEIKTPSRYLPRSVIRLKYTLESEATLLLISSYNAAYGYSWKESPKVEHQFYPLNFTYVNTDTIGNINEILRPFYNSLIFNGLILGPTYEYTYNSRVGPPRMNSYYFNGLIDLSGNLIGMAQKADYKTNPKELFGQPYAQYVKLQPDFRYYLRLSPATTIATRFLAGIGIPYGNSSQLPNIKQFWAGGNSDLRGFPSRLVGPGTFNEYDTNRTSILIETLGDLKMELNLELRQKLYKILHGAIFYDAGNIWTFNDNPRLPGGKFTSDFYKQLAADVGVGLRFDFNILILRLDMGIPIRKPWATENNGWVLNQMDFSSSTWRRSNMILNIAIGYPF
ncbi:MAG: BamA/TamA family outer membrane protein [Flavipsychrobacter sp.]|jgi:outer membrane protein assembly factor BamA|nr:BamA/TamA family outer membrane protein [Flavipsychrobacter sp.]